MSLTFLKDFYFIRMPIQAPQWTEFLSCPVCFNEFDVSLRSPISLGCGHTICKTCLSNLHRKQCPFDQTTISIDIDSLPVNTALLQLVTTTVKNDSTDTVDAKVVPQENLEYYMVSKNCIEELAMYLKPFSNGNICSSASILSRPMQRKLVTLINCQLVEDEGRIRAMRAARSLGERTVTELILQHQNPQQLSANLWAAVRARGCQFLGPAMQEEVLKLVLLALEDGSALSRKVLVMFVVQRLEPHFPQASKTSIGHVVQLLYRASCFKVSKREGDSSLMQLKEEFRTYEALRREHDAQIVQIATEAGLRIAPDQWSALLYGDTAHKSHMQSIIDKLQTPQSFAQSVQELVIALQRTGDPGKLSVLRSHLELLANIDPSPETVTPTWKECSDALEAVKHVVSGLVEFIHQHGSRKLQDPAHSQHAKYKISMCRDLTLRGNCPRGTNCTFAHSNEELEKYRAKNKKTNIRNKEHRIDNHSPNEKPFSATEDYFPAVNTNSNPVSIPAVVPLPRIGLDIPYNATFPPNGAPYPTNGTSFPNPQTLFPVNSNTYPTDIYNSNPHNIVFANGGQYYQSMPEFNASNTSGQNIDLNKQRNNWEQVLMKNQNVTSQQKSRGSIKTLAELQQRKQEVISQLETIFGKTATTLISNTATNLARQESDLDSPTSPYTFWSHISSAPTFVRSDSILAEDDYVPYDAPCVSKYGPISRMPKENSVNQNVQVPTTYKEGTVTTPMVRKTTANSVTPYFYNANPQFHQNGITSGPALVAPHGTGMGDGYFIGSPQLFFQRMHDPSKELLAESQRVKLQLRNLEKQLNDLKLATQGVTNISEGERLKQELQLIEQGIQEKQKEVCLNRIYSSLVNYGNGSPALQPSDEASYEEFIANDIRELELRLQEELEEHEKRWSSEDDSNTK
ncbi:putative zinc ion binding protein [Trypoxylus dichotomus]